ncbi:MAG TPA: hypothetical protein VFK21_03785 [Gammaproteobacteria bacterium]|nr:hypothetical protein [Gammaproteobacteria bacterium]
MKPIGGFLELELSQDGSSYHQTSLTYKSGRAAFNAILKHLHPSRVFVPFYCCDALLQPLQQGGIRYEFYPIGPSFEPLTLPSLSDGDLFVYVNYFDLKRGCIERLSDQYRHRLVVDATQSFYMRGNGRSWFFNSCRKFFGVPDGAYLYVPEGYEKGFRTPEEENTRYIPDHLFYRFKGDMENGYAAALQNEALLDTEQAAMSKLTRYLLGQVDYPAAATSRRENFRLLEQKLGALNQLELKLDEAAAPHYFPFLPDRLIEKQSLWNEQVFVPALWKDCLDRRRPGFEFELRLSSAMLPLPIDQRYATDDMGRVVDVALKSYGAT